MTDPGHDLLDIDEVPFSTRGAWMDLSRTIGLNERADDVHLVTHQTGMHPILRLIPTDADAAVDCDVVMQPHTLSWVAPHGRIDAVFDGSTAIRVRGRGLGLRLAAAAELTPFTGAYLFQDPLDDAYVLTSYESGRRYRLTILAGDAAAAGLGRTGTAQREVTVCADETGTWELAIEEFGTAASPYASVVPFDTIAELRRCEFAEFAEALRAGVDLTPALVKAVYVLWASTVAPSGYVTREAVLMSKHWMDKVWSWDHCFNAIALAPTDPDAALAQFLLPFDHQDPSGALPDSVTHSEVLFNFVKPPIHGWAFAQLRARSARDFTTAELKEVYDRLSAWTRFWLDYRRAPGHVLPYYQHGNDSGWDNATAFDDARPIESPDLAAFLLLQLAELQELAGLLGVVDVEWQIEADAISRALVDELWTGSGFIAREVTSQNGVPNTSLLMCLPIVLGAHLPSDISASVADNIAHHLTAWGPATEPVDSPHYQSDGYWRGPIWAPSTFLIEDGLRRAGHATLADRISTSFQAVCERSGFAENFDAVTGEGLRDRAYTWTASAYLTLATDAAHRTTSSISLTGER